MKSISKFRVRRKLQVISKIGDKHVLLGQKHVGIAERFFIVRDNFERVLQANKSVAIDAEVQRCTETGSVSVITQSNEPLPQLQDLDITNTLLMVTISPATR